jgi:C4-dicarboxylate-binding protein DctP
MVEMKKSGRTTVIELTPEQKTAWRKALEPVYTEMASRIGQDVIDEFQREAQVATK